MKSNLLALALALCWLIPRVAGFGATMICVDGPTVGGCDYLSSWFGIVSSEVYYVAVAVEAAALYALIRTLSTLLKRRPPSQ